LTQVQELAPGLADVLGDNPAGHFVRDVGGWAGKGDAKLEKALGYGQKASHTIGVYKGYLDKGLGYAGVKDPQKAFEKMEAREDRPRRQPSLLEKAIVRKCVQLAQGAHDTLGTVHDVVEKGLSGATRVESGLETATALA